MSLSAPEKLQKKYNSLKAKVDFGSKIGEESVDGGIVWKFERGALYWNPLIAKGAACAVWGGIYAKYVELGAHGINNVKQKRLLGYPIADEMYDQHYLHRVSFFQNGAIYWINGGAPIFGEIYKTWKGLGAEKSELGYPIGDNLNFIGGTAIYFERGCLWQGQNLNGQVVASYIRPPLIGKPKIINPTQAQDLEFRDLVALFGLTPSQVAELNAMFHPGRGTFLTNLWAGLTISRVVKPNESDDERVLAPIDNTLVIDPSHSTAGIDTGTHSSISGGPSRASIIAGTVSLDGISTAVHSSDVTTTPPSLPNPPDIPDWSDLFLTKYPASPPIKLSFRIQGTHLKERGLFDINIKIANKPRYTLSPNSVYTRKDWSNFGFIHATDIHSSQRNDYFGKTLRDAGRNEGADKYNNYNNNFRTLITNANALYDQGKIDFILMTGDLIDYVYDSVIVIDEKYSKRGGNMDYFLQTALGKTKAPDAQRQVAPERLRVPIFTTLGNHDYRPNPYLLYFLADGPGPLDVEMDQYNSQNLTSEEASLLTMGKEAFDKYMSNPELASIVGGGRYPRKGVSTDDASRMVSIDGHQKALEFYNKFINRKRSYTVPLGAHRVVMIDSAYDLGIVEGIGDAAAIYFGFADEDKKAFASSDTNQQGFTTEHLTLLSQSLTETATHGLVIVGVHGPPIDFSPRPPHYLRETEHTNADVNETKRGFPYFTEFFDNKNANWPMNGTPYFHAHDPDNLFRGISKGMNVEFFKLCLGIGASRKADLVLSGHGHKNIEFRLMADVTNSILVFFHDYYTENPTEYYATWLTTEEKYKLFVASKGSDNELMYHGLAMSKDNFKPFLVQPKPGVTSPIFSSDKVTVPLYSDPLNNSVNTIGWWNKHRPLFLQTGGIGPMEANQRIEDGKKIGVGPEFRGWRIISVEKDVIKSIKYIRLGDIPGS